LVTNLESRTFTNTTAFKNSHRQSSETSGGFFACSDQAGRLDLNHVQGLGTVDVERATEAIAAQPTAALEHMIDDGVCELLIVHHVVPRLQRSILVKVIRRCRRVAFVDDVKEHADDISAVREASDFIDDEGGWMRVGWQRGRQFASVNAADGSSIRPRRG
jgi:hypothetical protein